jgi:molecular chaperone HscA
LPLAGAARIRVSFQVDADGLLSVAAREATSGVAASVSVKPSYGLSDDDITRMLRDSFDHARDDVHVRALQEARVEGERMLAATESALAADGDLLEAAERAAIDADLAALRAAVAGTDHRLVKSSIDRVNRVTEPFAARRMDRTVRRALAGRSVETFPS